MKKTTINITDFTRIKNAVSKYPNITSADAEEQLKYTHSDMIRIKTELRKAREIVNSWEQEYEIAKEEFNKLAELFDIEYETITKEHITHETTLGIVGMGNDILGEMH